MISLASRAVAARSPAARLPPHSCRSPLRAMASSTSEIVVRQVTNEQQLQEFKAVTASYLEWLGEDLGFQGIERELALLPGSYSADKGGCMLLAYDTAAAAEEEEEGQGGEGSSSRDYGDASSSGNGGGEVCVGAVALRRLAGHTSTLGVEDCVAGVPLQHVCEMKRLFVLPGHHGRGAGARLVRVLLAEAGRLGYRLMVLDTLDRLTGANRLYSALGFQPCERYNDCPLPGVLYFARQLGGSGDNGSGDGSSSSCNGVQAQ